MLSFHSSGQERLYQQVLDGLGDVGYLLGNDYVGPFIREDYQFTDWFSSARPLRSVKAVAFAQSPPSYSTSSFSVILADRRDGLDLVRHSRAVGAPYAFEICEDHVNYWAVGLGDSTTKKVESLGSAELADVFRRHKQEWSGPEMLRLKNVAIRPPLQQAGLFDFDLVPALESRVHTELDTLLKSTLYDAVNVYKDEFYVSPDARLLFRLAFGLLSAKILHDRQISDFKTLGPHNITQILTQVSKYYKLNRPILDFVPSQQIIADGLWKGAGLEHVSIESLEFIYENTFVSDEDRDRLGIHGTPYSLARHIVHRLPFDRFDPEERRVLEPCCGHGIFLVAALERLRELPHPYGSRVDQHEYFKRMLRGFDTEPFSIEVASLCLRVCPIRGTLGGRTS